MQVNCSTSHILNKTVSDDELRLLARWLGTSILTIKIVCEVMECLRSERPEDKLEQ